MAHQALQNAPIVEAVCEIRFQPAPERVWTSTRPMPLYRMVSDQYPEMEMLPDASLVLNFDDGVPRQVLQGGGQRIKFSNTSGTRRMQMSADGNVLVLNFLRPYPGWEEVQRVLLDVWDRSKAVLNPVSIHRVGLRYINRIVHTPEAPTIAAWIKETPSIPARMITGVPPSTCRLDLKMDDAHRLVLNVHNSEPTEMESEGATILDIDRIWEGAIEADRHDLSIVVDRLHEDVWGEFSASLTPGFMQRDQAEDVPGGRK